MNIEIRKAVTSDLERILEVENLCFPQEEAATREAFIYRLEAFEDSFYVAEADGSIVGLINGAVTDSSSITDDLFEPDGGHDPAGKNQTIFGLAVHPDYQKRGIAEHLMKHQIETSRSAGREKMILTCKEHLIHYYQKFGYKNEGVSASVHGGAVWYDMVMEL